MQKLILGNKVIQTQLPAFVMGIVNATSDSFYSQSRGGIERAFSLIDQGAHIIDIGGESTRPGFKEINTDEEIKRVIPVIKAIRKQCDIPVSVDTRKYEVMKAALDCGADVLNDVSALEYDERLGKLTAESKSSVILTHNFFSSQNYNSSILYSEKKSTYSENDKNHLFTDEVCKYLQLRVDFAKKSGISVEKIILDPGIGFGKTFEQDLNLLQNLDRLCKMNFPVLLSLSRKRFIGEMISDNEEMKTAEKRLSGTLAANLIGILKGAKIVRVHDVQETVDTLRVLKYNI